MSLGARRAIAAVLMIGLSILIVNPSAAESKASETVASYMQALFSGDIATLETCLGKDLRERRKAALNDPDYARFLADRYENARYRILGMQNRQNGLTAVDVEITFGSAEKMTVRFILDHQDKIIDEISI